ncbi:capsular biosynthesis protein [Atlantibacter sp.]|uniref:capsule biosynthesis protein n=1 Tax=Atlantibacter sp. TaxID=1903473 RepID=UPI0028A942CE|nr:capsular biosynthesis protein [Atlantibacter sp.]
MKNITSNFAVEMLLSGKKYLLLQGPMGPFFSDLADWLISQDREVTSVIFNGGDYFYNRKNRHVRYTQTVHEFPSWLKKTWEQYNFDTIICFGDCRPLHQAASSWSKSKKIQFLVFEEGYLRPHFITLEKQGVNAFSTLPKDPDFYRNHPPYEEKEIKHFIPSIAKRNIHATWYYLMGSLYKKNFPNYRHHKSFSPIYEARCWIRAWYRKKWYALLQHKRLNYLTNNLDNQYFLAILQVYNDSQIRNHSPYDDIRDYINEVIYSFSKYACSSDYLVFKHHPMDRGHRLYSPLIKKLEAKYHVKGRIIYIHDLSMPKLLTHSKAVITINSTAGISALIHNKPLKVMGKAIYDMKGLTYQGNLNSFWKKHHKPDMLLLNNFRNYLLQHTQINNVFYK